MYSPSLRCVLQSYSYCKISRGGAHGPSHLIFIHCANILQDAKAELNPHNLSGVTPLQWAVERRNYDVVDYLLEKGAELKIDAENRYLSSHLYSKGE